ncbi:hypothetical protein SRB5_03730 [Streptomyces sp. RB5]|uniref:Uncharacterized protein n=1 Tax=Streptomyces smaragdinus TaxID=2585196 RepID=A0A7K0CA46_9ACTN|nr:hypothetical protein [Streptomyces smaragdinus]MQY10266.1 hypothetical protein [Streptomyces smaragdinus]
MSPPQIQSLLLALSTALNIRTQRSPRPIRPVCACTELCANAL